MNKEATQLSDPTFVGHTELIAGLCGAERVTMMLTNGQIAVTHVSTHCSLQEAIHRVRRDRVLDVIRLTNDALARFLDRPRIAVCGSTRTPASTVCSARGRRPHRSSDRDATAEGIDASGPHPADTVFFQAVHRQQYDAIVCMYHDQGHAPMKLLAFEDGVNVTLGLPIIRTSSTTDRVRHRVEGLAFTQSLRHALGLRAQARRSREV
jgi:4-hydroxythreonine-4-phosphate dehydrogenase